NVLAVILCYAAADLLIAITRIRAAWLVPFLAIVIVLGAFMERNAIADVLLTCAIGACGLAFVRYGWPRVPVLLGLALGPLAENRLFLSIDAYGAGWIARPGVLAIAAIMI